MGIVNQLLVSAQLAFGRNPDLQWISDPVEYTYGPLEFDPALSASPNPSPGISTVDAVTAFVVLSHKFKTGQKTGFYTITGFDATTTYTLALTTADRTGGFSYTTLGQASAQAAVEALAAAIEADRSADNGTRALAIRGTSGTIDTVMFWEPEDPTGALTAYLAVGAATGVSGGTGTHEAYVDATNTGARVWARIKRPIPASQLPADLDTPWVIPTDAASKEAWDLPSLGSTPYGRVGVFDVAGFERIYVELHTVTKAAADAGADARPYLLVGTAALES